MMKRLRYFWIIYTGNLYACNRRYWGWISIRTAWEAAGAPARYQSEPKGEQ